MSRKLVWCATFLLGGVLGGIAGPACAQYPGYGAYDTDPYRTRLHDYGPGYSGGLGFETTDHSIYIDEYGRRYMGPNGFEQPAPEPVYAPPPAPAYAPPPPAYAPSAPVYAPRPQRQASRVYADPLGTDKPSRHVASDADLGEAANRKTAEIVASPGPHEPGTVVIDTGSRHLYLVTADGRAVAYGIGVGPQCLAWKGTANVHRKVEWPSWTPSTDMRKTDPRLPARMAGGIENPLGARELYLFQDKRDIMFAIHGTNEPDTVGKAVSTGCIRMLNADVIDLYRRVPLGAKAVVL